MVMISILGCVEMRSVRTISFMLGMFLMTMASSSFATEVIVVASSVPHIKPGQIVSSNATIEIPAGSTVTLVSESGKTVTLKGPHSGLTGIAGESERSKEPLSC